MSLSVGDPAPDITLRDDEGAETPLAQLYQQPLVLLFVRHFGCPFCREHLAEVRDDYERIRAAGGDVAVVTMGTPEQTAQFKKAHKLPFTCLSDPDQKAYQAFDVPRGDLGQVAGPAVWGAGLSAVLRAGVGVPQGDLRQLQETAIIDTDGIVRYLHRPSNSADNPSSDEIVAALKALASNSP